MKHFAILSVMHHQHGHLQIGCYIIKLYCASVSVSVAKICLFHASGLPVVGEIEEPGFLEGGDYFAAGEDLALVGVGLRSNIEACEQLMNRDWLGTDRLAVVRDDFEQHQVSSLHVSIKSCWL